METFSKLLAFCERNPPVTGGFPPHRPVTRSFDVFCAWTNGWVNNWDAGDLRRHDAHHDVTVIWNIIVIRAWISYHIHINLWYKYSSLSWFQWLFSKASIVVRAWTSNRPVSQIRRGALRRLVSNQREVMTRLLELLYVLNIKRNIFESVLHIPTLWHFGTSVTYPPWFRRVKLVVIPPRFI